MIDPDLKISSSCIVSIIPGNGTLLGYIIHYKGGEVPGVPDWNLWAMEIEECANDANDIFSSDPPPKEVGFWVWEGFLTPVKDDAPIFKGRWRPAVENDLLSIIRRSCSNCCYWEGELSCGFVGWGEEGEKQNGKEFSIYARADDDQGLDCGLQTGPLFCCSWHKFKGERINVKS